ncbi:MAG TPA: low molecular weight protein-tyrosine-phosphatase [Patescibacteria group bacterium]|nr:low molecular weight protein-tyrosine-phosphatase [Patescibacteria group bacterium]
MVKVLFVCTGNICRSPTAEGLMRALITQQGLSGQIHVDSAGTHDYHIGEPPDPRSIQAALTRDVDIRQQRARAVAYEDFDGFDIIAVMDRGHRKHLLKRCPHSLQSRIVPLLSFADPPPEDIDVPDPYYGDRTFDEVFNLIDCGVAGLLAHIRQTYPLAAPVR